MRIHRGSASTVILAWLAAPAAIGLAADILDHVPADCAAVLVIRDHAKTAERLDIVGRRMATALEAEPSEWPVSHDMIKLHLMGIEPRWCNAHAPVVLMLMRADLDEPRIVVGFTRADTNRFEHLGVPNTQGSQIRLLRQNGGTHGFGTRFGDFVFISTRQTMLERLTHLAPAESLAASLSPDQRRIYKTSDVWLHARIKPWLPRLEQGLDQGAILMKVFGTMRPDATESSAAVFDWFFDAAKSILNQLRTTDVAVKFDDEGMTFTHLHEFDPDGSVAAYLGSCHRAEGDCLAGLPDEPFVLVAGDKLRSKESIWASLIDRLCTLPAIQKKISDEDRKSLRHALDEWYRDLRGSNFMFLVGPTGRLPAEIHATYACKNSDTAMDHFACMQSTSQEFMAFMPGGDIAGKFHPIELEGIKAREMKFDFSRSDPMTRTGVEMMYGRKPHFVVFPTSPTQLAYVLSERRESIRAMLKLDPAHALSRNESVRAIRRKLPADPHLLVIVDIAQALGLAPQFAKSGMPGAVARPALAPAGSRPMRGAYLAWSLVVAPHSLRGEAFVSYDDLLNLLRQVRTMQFSAPQDGSVAASGPAAPPQRAVPHRPSR